MKIRLIISVIFVLNITIAKSQTEDKKSGFESLNLSYIYSIKGGTSVGVFNTTTQIPLGIGISCSYKFTKKIYTEIGFAFKKQKEYSDYSSYYKDKDLEPGDWIRSLKRSYVDVPLQLNFKYFNYKSLNLFAVSGIKGTLFISEGTYYGHFKDYILKSYSLNFACNLGLLESFKINNKLSVFCSQTFGYYFLSKPIRIYNNLKEYMDYNKTFDFKLGISYKIK